MRWIEWAVLLFCQQRSNTGKPEAQVLACQLRESIAPQSNAMLLADYRFTAAVQVIALWSARKERLAIWDNWPLIHCLGFNLFMAFVCLIEKRPDAQPAGRFCASSQHAVQLWSFFARDPEYWWIFNGEIDDATEWDCVLPHPLSSRQEQIDLLKIEISRH